MIKRLKKQEIAIKIGNKAEFDVLCDIIEKNGFRFSTHKDMQLGDELLEIILGSVDDGVFIMLSDYSKDPMVLGIGNIKDVKAHELEVVNFIQFMEGVYK